MLRTWNVNAIPNFATITNFPKVTSKFPHLLCANRSPPNFKPSVMGKNKFGSSIFSFFVMSMLRTNVHAALSVHSEAEWAKPTLALYTCIAQNGYILNDTLEMKSPMPTHQNQMCNSNQLPYSSHQKNQITHATLSLGKKNTSEHARYSDGTVDWILIIMYDVLMELLFGVIRWNVDAISHWLLTWYWYGVTDLWRLKVHN